MVVGNDELRDLFLAVHLTGLGLFFTGEFCVVYTLVAVRLAAVRSVRQLETATAVVPLIKWIMSVATVLSLGSGIALGIMHTKEYSYKSPFFGVAIAGLAVLFATGAGLVGPRMERVRRVAKYADDGVTLRSLVPLTSNRVMYYLGLAGTGTLLAYIPLMFLKWDLVGSVLILGVGALVGWAVALLAVQPWDIERSERERRRAAVTVRS
jgi:hypothetical protein